MVGVPTTPEDIVLTPAESLAEAQRLLAAGRPFHAHEVLEGAWKASGDDTRELWKGLAQLAVGITHARRGNGRGAVQLLTRAADRIEPYAAAAPYGVAVDALTTWARALATRIEHGGGEVADQLAPRLVEERPAR
jgi:predicted metal-dependent hydrolase